MERRTSRIHSQEVIEKWARDGYASGIANLIINGELTNEVTSQQLLVRALVNSGNFNKEYCAYTTPEAAAPYTEHLGIIQSNLLAIVFRTEPLKEVVRRLYNNK